MRGATAGRRRLLNRYVFQSTLPVRGATGADGQVWGARGISIHAPREGSDIFPAASSASWLAISIHAPREGSDCISSAITMLALKISIHAPREGSDGGGNAVVFPHTRFQSTLPVRGATRRILSRGRDKHEFQSTLPVRGATAALRLYRPGGCISIHAPREGSDLLLVSGVVIAQPFQSTLPVRGATPRGPWLWRLPKDFNPRSP